MSRVAPSVPADNDLLCEFCGYTLNGLPEGSNCPECGVPRAASLGQSRQPPRWEAASPTGMIGAFFHDSARIIFTPGGFYKSITTRGNVRRALGFGWIHCLIASILFGIAGMLHATLFIGRWGVGIFNVQLSAGSTVLALSDQSAHRLALLLGMLAMSLAAMIALVASIFAASRLTAWEAAYRGYRLPLAVVRRGLAYHAAHYLPVAILTLMTVGGYRLALQLGIFQIETLTTYLYVLCAEVIIFAGYLFETYWIGMRNMMYANR